MELELNRANRESLNKRNIANLLSFPNIFVMLHLSTDGAHRESSARLYRFVYYLFHLVYRKAGCLALLVCVPTQFFVERFSGRIPNRILQLHTFNKNFS